MSTALTGENNGTGNASANQGTGSGNANGAGGNPAGTGAAAGGYGQAGSGGAAGGSAGPTSWLQGLPEELRTNPSLVNFSDLTSFAKSYLSTKEMVGKKGVIVPGEKASDEEWARFHKEIGMPDADKYSIASPKDIQVNDALLSKFKETAMKAGLLPRQAQGVYDWYISQGLEIQKQQEADFQLEAKRELEGLQKEWGNGYDRQVGLAKMAVKELGGTELSQYLEETGLGNDSVIIKFMAKVGALMGEDKLRGDGAGRMGNKTPNELQRGIDKLMEDPAYADTSHPAHKRVSEEVSEFFKQLHPS